MFFALQAESFIFTLVACAAYLPSSESIRSHSIRRNLAGASQGLNATSTIFDYVIVGGGTAGLTLAARLSETPSTRVAVIEAGGFYEDSIGNGSQLSIPAEDILWAGKNVTDVNLNVDWGFDTVPQAVRFAPELLVSELMTPRAQTTKSYIMRAAKPSAGARHVTIWLTKEVQQRHIKDGPMRSTIKAIHSMHFCPSLRRV